MITEFEDYIARQTGLSDRDLRHIISLAKTRKLRRNEFLFHEGDICRHKVFVAKGLMRIFGLTPDGSEHILQFSPQDSWIVDAESYNQGIPSLYNVDAIEPSEILLWHKDDFDTLLATMPQLTDFSQQLILHNTYSGRRRLLTALSASPEEKYQDFVTAFPDLLSRLPLRMIAAYLGISLKTLDRVRRAQLQRGLNTVK